MVAAEAEFPVTVDARPLDLVRVLDQSGEFGQSLGMIRRWVSGAEVDLEADVRKRQFIPGEQGPATHTLPVHLRPVRAAEVANKQQTVGACDYAVQF